MKACFLRAPAKVETNPLEYGEFPEPAPAAGEALVRVKVCGVCRTDLHVIEGELPPKVSPVIPGHQAVGCWNDGGHRLAAQDRWHLRILPSRRGKSLRCGTVHRVQRERRLRGAY